MLVTLLSFKLNILHKGFWGFGVLGFWGFGVCFGVFDFVSWFFWFLFLFSFSFL